MPLAMLVVKSLPGADLLVAPDQWTSTIGTEAVRKADLAIHQTHCFHCPGTIVATAAAIVATDN